MIGILEPENFSPLALAELETIGQVKLYDGSNTADFLSDIKILAVRLGHMLDGTLLDHAGKLEIICSPTTGLNHIDLAYCEKRGIKIISLKGETEFLRTIRATPEHTLGLIISLYRNYRTAFLTTRNNIWDRDRHKGYEISGSKIGIIGFGRVGSIVAGYLMQMGAQVACYDPNKVYIPTGVNAYDSIDELIQSSETIVLCSSYNPSAGSILNQREIDMMGGKWFVNTARAELTDEDYLVKKASENHFRGVAIDVILDEQAGQGNLARWLDLSDSHNVIITPHIGGATFTSMARTEEFIVKKLKGQLG